MVACILLFFNKLLYIHHKKCSIDKKQPDYSDRLNSYCSQSALSLWSAAILTPGIFSICFLTLLVSEKNFMVI